MKFWSISLTLMLGFILTSPLITAQRADNYYQEEIDQVSVMAAVSIVPQVEWIEEIGGEYVDVLSLIPAGQSPHTYNPTTSEMIFMSDADVWFSIGVTDFDKANKDALIAVSENPNFQYVDLSVGLELLESEGHDHEEHMVLNQETENVDPHTWLSPTRTIIMLETIRDKLQEIDPAHSAIYASNAATYISKLTALNASIASRLGTVNNTVMLIFHPSWGYYAHDYGLEIIALEEDGKDPSSVHLIEVIEEAKEHNVGAIFIQQEISSSVAEVFARDACVEIVRLYPLASDYIDNLNWTTDLFVEKLDKESICLQVPGFTAELVLFVSVFMTIPIIIKRRKNGEKKYD